MNKGLQKFTESEQKFKLLLQRKKVELADVNENLNNDEKEEFSIYLTKMLHEKKDEELDTFIEQISGIIPQSVKNQLWENNHYQIAAALSKLIEEYGKMPTKNMIAKETGLSRQTIHKHLKEYRKEPLYLEEMEKFRFLTDRVLAKVFKYAMNGEIKAARLYFEVLGYLGNRQNDSNRTINTQNNYIQINQTKFSQETLKHLNKSQILQIEEILKTATEQLEHVN